MIAELVSAVANELFSAGLAGGLHRLMKRRLDSAREILLSELESRDALIQDVADLDEVAAMVFEYASAAQRGSARMNLRLMAQVFVGGIQASPIYADEFLRWASMIASLSREEVIVAAHLHRHKLVENSRRSPKSAKEEIEDMVGPGKLFKTGTGYARTLATLTRTGLVVPHASAGPLVYIISDLMDELIKLIDIEAALQETTR